MGMRFAPTWLRHMSPMLHMTTLTTSKTAKTMKSDITLEAR